MTRGQRIVIGVLVLANVVSGALLARPAYAARKLACPDERCRGASGPCEYNAATSCNMITQNPAWCQTYVCQDT
jgi:hypothetical protein